MDPQQLEAQARAIMVQELNLGHLSEAEQDTILEGLSEVLMRRVLLKLMELLPENERDNFGKLLSAQQSNEAQVIVETYIPNSPEVIKSELQAGIQEHKRLVAEEVAKSGVK